MWGRIKRKVSRSQDSAPPTTCDEQHDCIDDELTGLNNLSLHASSDFVNNLHHCPNDANQMQAVPHDVSCHSSIVHDFSNHGFDMSKNQKQTSRNHFQNNSVNSDTSMLLSCQSIVSEQERAANSCAGLPQNENGMSVKHTDAEKYSHLENCNGCATDDSCKAELYSSQVVEEMLKNSTSDSRQRVCSSPPKLMRREKVRTGDFVESRKSRLSFHQNNNRDSATSFPKPLELPLHTASTNSLTPDDVKTDEVFEAHVSSTVVSRKPNVLSGNSSTSDSKMSTEPSTAESTDSGFQPSLCSGNEDRCLNSSGGDGIQDNPFSERFTSQTSDYMLLEDAKAMMASSLPAGATCMDYVDHFVVEACPHAHDRCTTSNHTQQVPVDYVPYCESVTVLRRISHDPVNEINVRQASSDSKAADYIPIDSSFAALYNGQSLSVRQNDANAHVTTGTQTDSRDIGRRILPLNQYVSDHASKPELSFSNFECSQASGTGNMQIQSQPVGFDLDSDDDSYLPPLPSRNYRNTSERYTEELMMSPDTLSDHVSSNEERTHMSWEEVMKEAHALGIPLSAPCTELPDRKCLVPVTSSNVSDFVDYPASSNHSDYASSELAEVSSSFALQDVSNTSQTNSPSKVSALAKCASPFKEKFRLHNLFSKKKSKKTDADCEVKESSRIVQRHSSAAAEIQRRNLPPLPPKRRQISGSNMSRSSLDPITPSSHSSEFTRPHTHRTLSTLTLPARDNTSGLMTGSVWAGSSASVGAQSEVGICNRSVSSFYSDGDLLMQGNFVRHIWHI